MVISIIIYLSIVPLLLFLFPQTPDRYFKLSLLVLGIGIVQFLLLQSLTIEMGNIRSADVESVEHIIRQDNQLKQAANVIVLLSFVLSSMLTGIQLQNSTRRAYYFVIVIQIVASFSWGLLMLIANAFII